MDGAHCTENFNQLLRRLIMHVNWHVFSHEFLHCLGFLLTLSLLLKLRKRKTKILKVIHTLKETGLKITSLLTVVSFLVTCIIK